MKQAYRILFLFLAIIFSFGFTNTVSTCQTKETKSHNCCQSSSERSPLKKKCNGSCCTQTTAISKLEDGIVNIGKEQSKAPITFRLKQFYFFNLFQNKEKLVVPSVLLNPVLKAPNYSQNKTQSWLI